MPALRAVQLNDRAAEDLALYVDGLRAPSMPRSRWSLNWLVSQYHRRESARRLDQEMDKHGQARAM